MDEHYLFTHQTICDKCDCHYIENITSCECIPKKKGKKNILDIALKEVELGHKKTARHRARQHKHK